MVAGFEGCPFFGVTGFIYTLDVRGRTLCLFIILYLYTLQKEITDISLSADNLLLASACLDKSILVWDLRTNAIATALSGHTVCYDAVLGSFAV